VEIDLRDQKDQVSVEIDLKDLRDQVSAVTAKDVVVEIVLQGLVDQVVAQDLKVGSLLIVLGLLMVSAKKDSFN